MIGMKNILGLLKENTHKEVKKMEIKLSNNSRSSYQYLSNLEPE